MFRSQKIICPHCGAETVISVSSGDGKDSHVATSSCRACRQLIMTVTLPDGQVAMFNEGELAPLISADPANEAAAIRNPRRRHRVLPPQKLGVFDRGRPVQAPVGVSDETIAAGEEVVGISQLLWRPDGTRRPAKDAARTFGWRAVWLAELGHNLQLRFSRPPPFSEPESVFLSYRWGNEAQNHWVAELAETLAKRHYRVSLDRLVPPEEVDVPEFVSSIVDCRYFLAIIDPGYVKRLGTPDDKKIQDGWVFDEVQTAFHAENQGLIRVVGLLREGSALPSEFRFPGPGQPGNTIDVRGPQLLAEFLDDVFPQREPISSLAQAEAAYQASLAAFDRINYEEAFEHASTVVDCAPDIIDGYAQQVRICLAVNDSETGLTVALAALRRFPEFYELQLAAAMFAVETKDPAAATRHAARALEAPGVPSEERAKAHAVLGTALDDFDQVDPALAHLTLAMKVYGRAPSLLQTAGYIRRRKGEPDAAARLFSEALQSDPQSAPLHENVVLALIEAGRPAEARAALSELIKANPDHPAAATFSNAITQSAARKEKISLLPRVSARTGTLRITCSDCQADLVVDEGESLCAGCGCPRAPKVNRCSFCEADGIVPILPAGIAAVLCPFCRTGSLSATPLGEVTAPSG